MSTPVPAVRVMMFPWASVYVPVAPPANEPAFVGGRPARSVIAAWSPTFSAHNFEGSSSAGGLVSSRAVPNATTLVVRSANVTSEERR
jgi:hypothetical protein